MDGPLLAPDALARLLDMSVDAIIVVDEDERIVHFNLGASQIFGYEPAEALGKQLNVLLPAYARAAHHGHMHEFAASATVTRHMAHRGRVAGVRRNGEEFPAEASIVRLVHEGRTYLAAVLRDVTERARDDANKRLLVNASAVLTSSLDPDEIVTRLAELAVPALGDACVVDLPDAEGVEREPLVRFTQSRAAATLHAPDPALDRVVSAHTQRGHLDGAGDVRSVLLLPLVTHDGLLGVMACYSGARLHDEADVALGVQLAERAALALANANLYVKAQRASRSRDEVLAVVSHDLRNPLSTIAMCASALSDPVPPGTEDVRSMADIIRQSSDWAQRIIRDLLDVSSIEAGRLSLQRELVHPETIVEASVALFTTQAEAAGIRLESRTEEGLPSIEADAERLLQVTFNLLGNAMKFTSRGGTVTIDASRDEGGNAVRFRVTDTGAGIPAEHLPHLFDRYWQLHRTHRGGAGLGLAIAKGIVLAHGGAIVVTSTMGQGSTFAFTIPIAPS